MRVKYFRDTDTALLEVDDRDRKGDESARAAQALGVPRPRLNRMLHGRFDGVTIDKMGTRFIDTNVFINELDTQDARKAAIAVALIR